MSVDKKYISKQVALSKGNYEIVDDYRKQLQKDLGFRVSLAQAITHAITKATATEPPPEEQR